MALSKVDMDVHGTIRKFQRLEFLAAIEEKKNLKNELRMVVIGKTGTENSATANTILKRKQFKSSASGSSVTSKCQWAHTKYDNRSLLLVDTPGVFDTNMSNAETSEELMKCVAITSPGIHAVLLVIRCTTFTKEEVETVEIFKDVFGEDVMKHMIVVVTGKDCLEYEGKDVHKFISESPPYLQNLVSECGGRVIAVNNLGREEEKDTFRQELLNIIDGIVKDNDGKCFTNETFEESEMLMRPREDKLRRNIGKNRQTIKERLNAVLEKGYTMRNVQGEYEEKKTKLKQLGIQFEKETRTLQEYFENELEKDREKMKQLKTEAERSETKESIAQRKIVFDNNRADMKKVHDEEIGECEVGKGQDEDEGRRRGTD